MTLRMADGPVANLPAGLDAYAGYVDKGGIGITFPDVAAAHPSTHLLSIAVHGAAGMCGDVENGALSNWTGYGWGYCAVSNVNDMIRRYGRPKKLWTAHYDKKLGSHICSPHCWPGLVTTADGTQWTNHGGVWDESLLSDDFFSLSPIPTPSTTEGDNVGWTAYDPDSGGFWATDVNGDLNTENGAPFIAGLNQHPEFHAGSAESGTANPCVGIETFKDKNGQHGIAYITRTSGSKNQSGLSFYRFARDGSTD
jgi:hypothetical protein